ncbi:MAG: 16S rRNA (adenine(1518)-N(6)/adenine(1519)-N(6))-dimethyltransferase RsmA [Bacteroidales bacterium]|jgi:16S rRNA (adenine1518-N6/adenine1519-N6)-dimethyltransferase|nr:16S rRNA (adenine(1518)-N(6)/adenine(1519)-N(6))-dimethyltransferase RsmA [Bacteroidales bacterium]
MPLVKPKKNLGQHFLRNEDIARQIAESIVSNPKNVLEIGPGMGVLTKYLIPKGYENLNVVEIDRESVEYLQQHYPDLREHIWSKDFLTLDLASLFDPNLTIIGNFPYNISSQILFKVLDYKELVNEVVGMFQKEVAERVAAKPGNRQYGILSVLLQAFYDIEYLFTVDEYQFLPPPKVKSAVIRLTRNPEKQLHCAENLFKQVVKSAFNQRRKTLRNSLNQYNFSDVFKQDPIFTKRPEQLSVQEFEQICLNVIV